MQYKISLPTTVSRRCIRLLFLLSLTVVGTAVFADAKEISSDKIRLLIVDGQNNHGTWPRTTAMMKKYLEQSGRFKVDIKRTRFTSNGGVLAEQYALPGFKTYATKSPQMDPDFKPDFSNYDAVLSNFGYGAAPWPEVTRANFEKYIRKGGGFVVVHAADNSFGDWDAYNKIIGVGGWGGRTPTSGPYVYFDANGQERRDTSAGPTGSHGPQHAFPIVVRDRQHPITRGMPKTWMHARDELYDYLRGPAENMQVLATAYSAKEQGGSGNHVPMLITVRYGDGRVFHTPMGHDDAAMQCAGFATALVRGAEWAATGDVTLPIPDDFPGDAATSIRTDETGED
ncbi:MAG: trehalose utilization [Planctomycetaceae bacterium]|nr:trehalose utilization [Planctomycetaceae bacterium]